MSRLINRIAARGKGRDHFAVARSRLSRYRLGMDATWEIFLAGAPGLEPVLADEARAAGFASARAVPGGVVFAGTRADAMRANLTLRGASRVLIRIAAFRALHLAQLDKRARRLDWARWLRPECPVRIEVTTRGSRIYHAGAARQRIARALVDGVAARVSDDDGAQRVMVRIEDDLCTVSLDTSGELLHRRGHKEFVGKAPMRDTLAALFLRACGFDGREPVVDPMCGSGTFVLEAADIAAGLAPGRSRRFAFEDFAGADADAWARLRTAAARPAPPGPPGYFGFDRDQGAVAGAVENAARAGVGELCRFERRAVGDLTPPEGPPGLVMVNPPYGARIGNRKLLFGLYGALGGVLKSRFSGWRMGLVTSDDGLARATGLGFADIGPPVPHGGMPVRLYRTGPIA